MIAHKVFSIRPEAEWICFVHGAGGSSSIWHPQIRAFAKKYNVLLLDLRGHGNSRSLRIRDAKKFNFDVIVDDIIEVLDHHRIQKANFIGISLGTIIIRYLAENHSQRVSSMILAGAVFKLSVKSKLLMKLGNLTKSFVPHMFLYRLLATIIIPNNDYRASRMLFVNEAKKIYRREFVKWFSLTTKIKPVLYLFREKEHPAPTLYVMGEHDRFFLPGIRSVIKHHKKSQLIVISDAGHVVNVDAPKAFNAAALKFLQRRST